MKRALLILGLFACFLGDAKTYDFEFRGMDLHKVLASLARLQKKNIIFSKNVETRAVEFSLTDVTPEQAMKLIAESYGYFVVDKGNSVIHIITPSERGPASESTSIIQLSHVTVKEIESNVRSFMGTGGKLGINESANVFIVSGQPELLENVRKLVAELDRPPMQIFIQAKVIQTTTNFSRQLGIQWGPQLQQNTISNGTAQTPTTVSNTNGINFNAPVGENTFVASLTNWSVLQAQIMAGESTGVVKVLSSPRVTTMNGVAASIESLDTFNIQTLASTGIGTAPQGQLQQVSSGVSLRVTPIVLSKNSVLLKILLTKSDPDTAEINGIPGISSNTASTQLVVRNGETASIGGLIQHSKSESHTGIPFLNTLPLIGGLFQNSAKNLNDLEVIIFLTPTIFEEGENVAGEEPRAVTIGASGDAFSQKAETKPSSSANPGASAKSPAGAPGTLPAASGGDTSALGLPVATDLGKTGADGKLAPAGAAASPELAGMVPEPAVPAANTATTPPTATVAAPTSVTQPAPNPAAGIPVPLSPPAPVPATRPFGQ